MLLITGCNEADSPEAKLPTQSSNRPMLLNQGFGYSVLLQSADLPVYLAQYLQNGENIIPKRDSGKLIIAASESPAGDEFNPLLSQDCALYSLSTVNGDLQCEAPGIFAETPTNSPYPALSFDQGGNLLVVGRRFSTYHTDTCLQPTPSGCAAWQVDYAIQMEDEEPQLYRIIDGLPQLIYTETDNKVLAGFAAMDNSLHILSATYAGYALESHLLRIDETSQHITDLGGASALLPTANGLLFVDQASALQFSTHQGLSKLKLPSMAPTADYWFNPAPQALAFDGQGKLYGLFQQRRLLQDGTWQDFLLSYRLLPYQATPVAEAEVSSEFFITNLPQQLPVTTADGYAVLDCHNAGCDLLVQHNGQLHSIALPETFTADKLLAAQNTIILDGHTGTDQLMQLQFGFDENDAVTSSSTLFPVEWQSVITIPAVQAIPPAEDLKITTSTLAEHSLSLSFNQAPTCSPQQITLHGTYGLQVFAGAYLQQAASLHLLNAPVASAITLEFNCAGEELHLEQILTEDSLAI